MLHELDIYSYVDKDELDKLKEDVKKIKLNIIIQLVHIDDCSGYRAPNHSIPIALIPSQYYPSVHSSLPF